MVLTEKKKPVNHRLAAEAAEDKRPLAHNWKELAPVTIFVPPANQIVQITEGSGDNLTGEDMDNGFVDYLYYSQYDLENISEECDGGQILKTELVRDLYANLTEAVPEVLELAYGNADLNYIVLEAGKSPDENTEQMPVIKKYDVELHQVYHLMHAYWYGSSEAKNGTVDLNTPYKEWAESFIEEHNGDEVQCEKAINDSLQIYCNQLHMIKYA